MVISNLPGEAPIIAPFHSETQQQMYLNILKPKQNDSHFADDIFNFTFILLCFNFNLLKFVPGDQIDNKSALVQIMAWRQIGDKPLFEQ